MYREGVDVMRDAITTLPLFLVCQPMRCALYHDLYAIGYICRPSKKLLYLKIDTYEIYINHMGIIKAQDVVLVHPQ